MKTVHNREIRSVKRAAIYARVSTADQTKRDYESCESQLDELTAYCAKQGWEVVIAVKDAAMKATKLDRPGLAQVRETIHAGEIDVFVCTWYNRLVGRSEFYIFDQELRDAGVKLVTIHDPIDRDTASGQFNESILVAVKQFENRQIGEKVKTKRRQRAEKVCGTAGMSRSALRSSEN